MTVRCGQYGFWLDRFPVCRSIHSCSRNITLLNGKTVDVYTTNDYNNLVHSISESGLVQNSPLEKVDPGTRAIVECPYIRGEISSFYTLTCIDGNWTRSSTQNWCSDDVISSNIDCGRPEMPKDMYLVNVSSDEVIHSFYYPNGTMLKYSPLRFNPYSSNNCLMKHEHVIQCVNGQWIGDVPLCGTIHYPLSLK